MRVEVSWQLRRFMGYTLHKYLSACLVFTSLVGISFSSSPVANAAAATSLGPSGISLAYKAGSTKVINAELGATNKFNATGYADFIRAVVSVPSGKGSVQLPNTTGLTLSLPNGYQATLTTSASTIAFEGTVANVNSALDKVEYSYSTTSTENVTLSVTVSYIGTGSNGVAYSDATGNFYQYVSSAVTWDSAFAATSSGGDTCKIKFNNLCGYLASVTSSTENSFVSTKTGNVSAWIGGNDKSVEGDWRWASNSPEAALANGGLFWRGKGSGAASPNTGSAQNGYYTNWNGTGEPNDSSSNEDALQILAGGTGQWNDLPTGSSTLGYVLEFGGFANDAPTYASTTRTLTLNIDGTVPSVSSFASTESAQSAPKTVTFSLIFSESVSTLESGDFTNSGSATGCVFTPSASSGSTFTISVSGCSTGTVIPRLIAGSVTDGVGNSIAQSTSTSTITFLLACVFSETPQGGYQYVAFKTVVSGCSWNVPSGLTRIDYLVVAGGGSGGTRHAGGGGAGGKLSDVISIDTNNPIPFLKITVGDGGASASRTSLNYAVGIKGQDSVIENTSGVGSFTSVTAKGGGGGMAGGSPEISYTNGGSGGGTQHSDSSTRVEGQGNVGGTGIYSQVYPTYYSSGGGGGSGGRGENGTSSQGGNGGGGSIWLSSFTPAIAQSLNLNLTGQVSGQSVYFSGGGGGSISSQNPHTAGTGGLGGGGDAALGASASGVSGTANSGGGGGGAGCCDGGPSGAGGSGVVILRYALPAASFTIAPDLVTASDTGSSNSDNLTKDTTPTFTGTTQAGSTVQIYVNGTASGSTCAESGGNYSCTTGTLDAGTYSITAKATTAGGVTSDFTSALSVTIKTSAPTISGAAITSTATDNFYKSGSIISVTLTTSENVTVSGTPTVTLAIGSNTRTATHVSGSGTSSLIFSYTVTANDSDSDGIALNANSLALAGGSIVDSAGNNATLTHSAISDSSGHKVDGSSPTVSSATLSGVGYYNSGDTITVTIAFSETVTVTGAVRIPVTGVTNAGIAKTVNLDYDDTLSTGDTKVFKYTVVDGDLDLNGIDIAANAVDLNGGSILDPAGNSATITYSAQAPPNTPTIDAVRPTVTAFSSSKASGNYKVGETISVSATISESVNSGAVLTVRLSTGADVPLTNASAGSTLTGNYTVSASDSSTVLSVISFVITTAPTDSAGNELTSTTLPGTNIASGINIDVDSPLISGPSGVAGDDTAAATMNENSNAVHTFTANESVTWSVVAAGDGGGSDASKFAISSGGALTFVTAPNYENPNDAEDTAANNTYVVKVKAVDVAGNIDTQTVTVSIANLVDTATVTSLTVTSSSGSDNAYTVGETIELTAVFTDVVTLTIPSGVTGYPRIELQGLASRFATYVSGSGTRSLLFRYTVVGGDVDADGFSVLANSIELDEVLIRNADNQNSILDHSAITATTSNKVDALAPLLASTTPSDNATGVALDANIVLTFTKAVVKDTGNITIYRSNATPAAIFEQIAIGDSRITLSGDQLTLTINPTGTFSNGIGYYVLVDSTVLKDASGNYFAGISNANSLNFSAKSDVAIATPSSGLTAYLNTAYTLTITSTLGSGTKSFSVTTGSLPAGLSLNSSTGAISGTPTAAGTSAIRVTVTDGSGTSAVTNSFTITVSAPTFRQFDNGKIRIGSASGENSVNAKGNFQQPWYKSGSTYFKLTFSSYSLNFAFGQGTANASYFNGNATPLTQDPTMSNQVLDYSGFVGTSVVGTGIRGYGTIISTGTFALGGITYQLKNTFVLGETSSSIRISTEFTNTSTTTTGRNLTFWAGTQDDWVGSTDRPTKTKGNLVNGSFVATTTQSAQARALRITSGSEAVLFFSTHPNVNTASNGCCSFTNTTNQNPTSSPLAQTNDGSYAMYVPFGDLAPSTTTSFTWYYAAGPTAELNTVINNLSQLGSDTTAPTISGLTFASSAGSDSTYKIGDSIDVNVAFSEAVNVTGSPRIPIVGLSSKFFTYVSGSGTSTLTFRYIVSSSDLDVDGLAVDANSLVLNSGNIGDAAGNNAELTHLALSAQAAHKVDGVAPSVSTFTPADGATGVPVNANIEIVFSEPISIATGNIYIKKVISGSGTTVEQIPINGSRVTVSGSTLTINPDANFESQSEYAIGIDSTAVLDLAGNAFAGLSDLTTFNFTSANASSPTVVRVTSDYTNGTYGVSDGGTNRIIPIKVVFSKIVNVTIGAGKPMLTLATGSSPNAIANYISGSGTTTLVFEYVVADGHGTADLDYASVDSLTLGTGAAIQDAAGNNATLTLASPGATNSLGANKAIAIDTSAPVVTTYSPISNATNVLADSNIVITFNDPMLIISTLSITLNKKGSSDSVIETFAHNSTRISLSGQVLTIDPTAALESFSEYFINISSPGLTDLAGNAFAGISGYTYSFKSENFTPTTPAVSSQPSNLTVTSGRSATLSATGSTTDLGVLTYQWYKGTTLITGATSSSYTISPVSSADSGDYKVVVTNTYRGLTASVDSNVATLTVNAVMSASFGGPTLTATYGTSTTSSTPTLTGGTGSKTWSITQTADSRPLTGISIDSSTGVISVSDALSAGTYEMTVSVTDASGSTSTSTISIVVAQKTVTISGMTASNKGYDTSTRATLSFTSATLSGVLTADASGVAIVSTSATGTFNTAEVGTNKTVTASGVSLSGPYAGNYLLTQPTATADITKGTQTITITSVTPAKPLPGRSYTPTATSNSLLTVTFTVAAESAAVCEVAAGVVNFLTSGTCRVHFNQAGDSSWEPAAQATQALVIGKLGQNITFGTLGSKNYGDSAFQVSSTSSSGLLVVFESDSNTSICTVSSIGIVKVVGVGTCNITASQSGNDAYSAATSVTQSFSINAIVPTAPRISSLNPGNEQATISWTAPQDNGGASITGYRVISQSPDDKVCETTGALFCTVSALRNGSPYTFTVTAINSAGSSLPSAQSTPVTPVTKADAVESLILVSGNGVLTASWSAPATLGGGTFTKYQLFIKQAIGGSYPGTPTAEITDQAISTYQFTGLTNGTAYTVKVITITSAPIGALEGDTAEVSQIPAVVPDAPRNLVAIAPTGNSATVTWSVPLSNGGASITGYTVTAVVAGRSLSCTAVTATSCFIETITVGTSLRMGKGLRASSGWNAVDNSLNVSVVANNLIGPSSPTSTSVVLPTTPGAPTITKVEAINGEIQITYTAPASDGGSAITGYTTTIFKRGTVEIVDTCSSSSLVCSVIVTGNIYDFDFKVLATNPVGDGEISLIFSPPVPARGGVFEPVKTPSVPVLTGGAVPVVAPGQSVVLAGGVAVEAGMKVIDGTSLSITNGSMQLILKSENALGETQGISENMILRVTQAKSAQIEAFGFKPESRIYVWIFSTPILLGDFKVEKDGTLKARFDIPPTLSVGRHTMQINGLSVSDSVISYTTGVEVLPNNLPGIRDVKWNFESELLNVTWAPLDYATKITVTNPDKSETVFNVKKGEFKSVIDKLEPGFIYDLLIAPIGLPANSAYRLKVDLPPRAPQFVKVYTTSSNTLQVNWQGSLGAQDYVVLVTEVRKNVEVGAPARVESVKATKETSFSFIADKRYEYEIAIYAQSESGKESLVSLTTGVMLAEESTPNPVTPKLPGKRALSVFFAKGKNVDASEKTKVQRIASDIKVKTLLTCIGYTKSSKPSVSAKKAALAEAKMVCSNIRGLNKKVTIKAIVRPLSSAPKVRLSANPKKTQRVDLYKK